MNANWSIENKKVLITGGTDGIGKVTALELAKHGAHVIVVGRNPQKTENTVREIRRASGNEKVDYLLADLSEQNEVRRIAAEYRRRYDRLHVLINNAGIHQFASAVDADLAMWDRMLDVNLRAAMHATRLALPHIVAGARAGRRGAVIFVSSLGGKFTAPTNAGYAATKHALTGFGGSVFEDARDFGVKVCVIYPGWTNTGLLADWLRPDEVIQPEDVAEAARFVIAAAPTVCPTEIVLQPQSSRAARLFATN